MRLLLDTHVLYWWLTDDARIAPPVRKIIADASDAFVSAASVWEMGIKAAAGKLRMPGDLGRQLARHRFTELPVSFAHARLAPTLPRHHKDPFDRMLVAQSIVESLTLLTADPLLAPYGCPMMRV